MRKVLHVLFFIFILLVLILSTPIYIVSVVFNRDNYMDYTESVFDVLDICASWVRKLLYKNK